MDTFFRFSTSEVEFEIEGSEDFVRRELRRFLQRLAPADAGPETGDAAASPLRRWYEAQAPGGRSPTMQDSILLFGYYLKRERDRHMFAPGDIKGAFAEVGRPVPKSLLQIMGTLRRDQGLLWSPGDKRGAYALSPRGIRHVEDLLGLSESDDAGEAEPADPADAPALGEGPDGEPLSGPERWTRLFRESGGSARGPA